MRVMKFIKAWLKTLADEHKNKIMQRMIRESNESFYLSERGGIVYIMCNGTSVKAVAPEATASQIAELLAEARRTALEFQIKRAML